MISVKQAKTTILKAVTALPPITLPLKEAFGLTLARDVFAITDIPAFTQSSMDGYAFNFSAKNKTLPIIGEMAAGAATQLSIRTTEAARIFTGAPLPLGADTVVMQEKIEIQNGQLIIKDQQLQCGGNVRPKGAEVKEGVLAMPANTYLSAGAIGFLAGIGISHVPVFPPPSITIILTGNELQEPGKPLGFAQVYEANAVMLTSALKQAGIRNIDILKAADDLEILQNTLNNALLQSDIILLTGGVSVGDYDFVVKATQNCGVQQQFHKIKQKPGKPLFFGTIEKQLIFGLPGNPSSVLTCFYEYVLPAIETILQKPNSIKIITATLSHDYTKAAGLTHFLKAKITDGMVSALQAQESFRLHSFAQANCLLLLEEEQENYHAGDKVEVHLLP